jgi:tetraacyldisaccharide 4'-kinase
MMNPLLGVYSMASRAACRLAVARIRAGLIRRRRAPLPVVSVGNLTLGGSEKTPLVMELLGRIPEFGLRPALVTRGYRGRWERGGGVVSDGKTLFAGSEEAGDEPFMAARRFPRVGVFVGKDRYRSCLKAKDLGFDVAILDDGFQHFWLGRDLDIVLHDPRGRGVAFREGIPALKRADFLLLKKNGD